MRHHHRHPRRQAHRHAPGRRAGHQRHHHDDGRPRDDLAVPQGRAHRGRRGAGSAQRHLLGRHQPQPQARRRRELLGAPRRDPRRGRAGGCGTHGDGVRAVRRLPRPLLRAGAGRRQARQGAFARPGHRARHLPGARRPQAPRHRAADGRGREHHAGHAGPVRARPARRQGRGADDRRSRDQAPAHQDRQPRAVDRQPLGRQPAEGGADQDGAGVPQGADPRRAHARRGRRLQVRHLPDDRRPGRQRRGDHHGLFRTAGDPGHERSCPGDRRRRVARRLRQPGPDPGTHPGCRHPC